MDTAALIFMVASMIAQWVVGWRWKHKTENPNELIPVVNGIGTAIAAAGLVLLLDVPIKDAVIAALGAMWTSIAGYEGAKMANKKVTIGAPLFVLLAALGLLVAVPANADDMLRPRWAGPVYGAVTNDVGAGDPGTTAKIHLPLVVAVTPPVGIGPAVVTAELEYAWTTKALLEADSDPLRDMSHEWFPHVRLEPDSGSTTAWQWTKVSPVYHVSNGEDSTLSRSMNAAMQTTAFAWMIGGVYVDVYVSTWWVYDYGEGTEGIADAINSRFWEDVGGKAMVRIAVDVGQLAVEVGPEWQTVMGYVPLADFYKLGLFAEYHHGKFESLIDYDYDDNVFYGGVALRPPL